LIVHLENLRGQGALNALAPVEFDFLVGLAKACEGESYRERRREIEWFLIGFAVERRVDEGQKQESAIRAVMKERNCTRTTVFKALAAYRRKYEVPDEDCSALGGDSAHGAD
jgi:hypothetical protein